MYFFASKKMPISRLNARGKDFFEKMIPTISKRFTFCLAPGKLAKNPDTFHQPIPKPKKLNRLFLPFSRHSRHFSLYFPIFPTNEVKVFLAQLLGSRPKLGKSCKLGLFLALSLTSSFYIFSVPKFAFFRAAFCAIFRVFSNLLGIILSTIFLIGCPFVAFILLNSFPYWFVSVCW